VRVIEKPRRDGTITKKKREGSHWSGAVQGGQGNKRHKEGDNRSKNTFSSLRGWRGGSGQKGNMGEKKKEGGGPEDWKCPHLWDSKKKKIPTALQGNKSEWDTKNKQQGAIFYLQGVGHGKRRNPTNKEVTHWGLKENGLSQPQVAEKEPTLIGRGATAGKRGVQPICKKLKKKGKSRGEQRLGGLRIKKEKNLKKK